MRHLPFHFSYDFNIYPNSRRSSGNAPKKTPVSMDVLTNFVAHIPYLFQQYCLSEQSVKMEIKQLTHFRYINRYLRELHTLGRFPSMFFKADNFCDFRSACRYPKSLLKWHLLKKKRICSQKDKSFHFRADSFSEGS